LDNATTELEGNGSINPRGSSPIEQVVDKLQARIATATFQNQKKKRSAHAKKRKCGGGGKMIGALGANELLGKRKLRN